MIQSLVSEFLREIKCTTKFYKKQKPSIASTTYQLMFASVRSSLEEYFETKLDDGEQEEAVVVASDGSLQTKKLDFKLRSALEK